METAGKTFIVDRDIGSNKVEGIYKTIQAAINDATPGSTIKISPGLYDESILIKTSGLILEPKERGGEVTIQQFVKPCIFVDITQGDTFTVNHIRMLLKGPNKDEDIHCYQVDMDFEKTGSKKCI